MDRVYKMLIDSCNTPEIDCWQLCTSFWAITEIANMIILLSLRVGTATKAILVLTKTVPVPASFQRVTELPPKT